MGYEWDMNGFLVDFFILGDVSTRFSCYRPRGIDGDFYGDLTGYPPSLPIGPNTHPEKRDPNGSSVGYNPYTV